MKPTGRMVLFFLAAAAAASGFYSCVSGKTAEDGTVVYSLKPGIQILAEDVIDSYWGYLDVSGLADKVPVRRLAVLPFVNEEGKKIDLGRDIANSMQVAMYDPELFSMLERERIDSILEEYKFSKTGLVEEISAAELGKLLGAELILVGTVTQKTYTSVISKIVDLTTGEIRAIGEVNLEDVPKAKTLDS